LHIHGASFPSACVQRNILHMDISFGAESFIVVHLLFFLMTGLSSSKVSVLRGQSLEQLEMAIVSLYPRTALAMAGFILARADKGRHIERFVGQTVDELEAFVGKGKLIVVPKRDLIMPEPVELQEVSNQHNHPHMYSAPTTMT